MKPYVLVLNNLIKFSFIKILKCKKFKYNTITMTSADLKLKFKPNSNVSFGNKIVSDGRGVILVDQNANLIIGDNVYFNEDLMISCKGNVKIGNGCKFGPNVKIFDNNHRFDRINGVSDEHSIGSVEIGEKTWIASNAVILKGAKIGKNCVIGAGCVVKDVVEDNSLVTLNNNIIVSKIN